MIKKFWSLLTVLILTAMVMSACATATTQAPVATVKPTAVPVTDVTFWHAYGTGSQEEVALTGVLAQAKVYWQIYYQVTHVQLTTIIWLMVNMFGSKKTLISLISNVRRNVKD